MKAFAVLIVAVATAVAAPAGAMRPQHVTTNITVPIVPGVNCRGWAPCWPEMRARFRTTLLAGGAAEVDAEFNLHPKHYGGVTIQESVMATTGAMIGVAASVGGALEVSWGPQSTQFGSVSCTFTIAPDGKASIDSFFVYVPFPPPDPRPAVPPPPATERATDPGAWGAPADDFRCLTAPPPAAPDGLFTPANWWPDAIVPVAFRPDVTPQHVQATWDGLALIEAVCDVDFVPHTGQHNHVVVENGGDILGGYSTATGMNGGSQTVGFGAESWVPRTIVHEFMHALGFYHEQQRSDRDHYVIIHPEALTSGNANGNFLPWAGVAVHGPYDFGSIMHYRWNNFADTTINRSIEVRWPWRREWAYRIGADGTMSNGDICALVDRYGGDPPPRAFELTSPPRGQAVGSGWAPSFSWGPSQDAQSYRLLVDDDPFFGSPEIDAATTQASYASTPGLQVDRLYYWTVTASNAIGSTEPFPFRASTFYTGASIPATVYVDDSAPAGGTGRTWNEPLRDLQDALALAEAADGWTGAPSAVAEIRVAQGTYTPDRATGDREMRFSPVRGVAIRGGYAGYGAPDPNARDIELFETILSGDLAGDDLPGFVNNAENTYNVLALVDADGTLVEGFTITGGNANTNTITARGVWAFAAAGVYVENGSPTIRDCVITACSALAAGGGGVIWPDAAPKFERCLFAGNAAGGGAGWYAANSGSATHVDCIFADNSAGTEGGAVIHEDRCAGTYINCLFAGNSAPFAAALRHQGAAHTSLVNCTFTANIAGPSSGALWADLGDRPLADNCIFWGNAPGEIVGPATVRHSLVAGGFNGPGNISADPLFVNAAAGDYRLAPGSPCIDAGDNTEVPGEVTTDLAGDPRFVDDPLTPDTGVGRAPIVDMGALEYQGAESGGACYADCNTSGRLTVADFSCFQAKFVAGDPYADCNGVGGLTIADFGCFQTKFVAACP